MIIIESIILCLLFTLMVYSISREPIKILFNYPPKIQERVKSLKEYKDIIPTKKNKYASKLIASVLFLTLLCIVLKYINGCSSFIDSFFNGFVLWTIVNLYDVIILDIILFCHDKYFIIKGTEDMIDEYHNYGFHIKGFFIGEGLALIICTLSALIVNYIL